MVDVDLGGEHPGLHLLLQPHLHKVNQGLIQTSPQGVPNFFGVRGGGQKQFQRSSSRGNFKDPLKDALGVPLRVRPYRNFNKMLLRYQVKTSGFLIFSLRFTGSFTFLFDYETYFN